MRAGKRKGYTQRDILLAYKKVFKSDAGHQVLCHLINTFHVLSTHAGDTFKEGQRSVVLDILQRCNIDIVEFDKLLKGEYDY